MAKTEYQRISVSITEDDKDFLDRTGRSPSKYLREKIREDRVLEEDL